MNGAGDGLVARTVLRALLRQARAWAADASAAANRGGGGAAAPASAASSPHHPLLAVRAPLATDAWRVGAHGAALAGPAYHVAALKAVLGADLAASLPLPPGGAWADGAALRAWILRSARHAPASVDAGLAGLRALQAQRAMERCSSSTTTAGVRVEATSALVAKKAGGGGGGETGLVLDWGAGGGPAPALPPPEEDGTRWLFTYRLRITHFGGGDGEEMTATSPAAGAPLPPTTGHPAVQLLTRAWTIREKSGRLHAAVPPGSPGLVGATPTLAVGECFEYYSATDLPAPSGVMKGAFGARWVGCDQGGGGGGEGGGGGGARFEVAVAPFALHADPLKVGGGGEARRLE